MFNWLKEKFTKKYVYGSQTFVATENEISNKLKEWTDLNPTIIPIDVSICQSRLSGTVISVLIYKKEVKSGS